MTPAEIAALRERLSRGFEDAGEFTVVVDKTDLRAALALLDAQAAEIARLTAELERARADAIEEAARVCDAAFETPPMGLSCTAMGGWEDAADHVRVAIRALAPAPAAEVAG